MVNEEAIIKTVCDGCVNSQLCRSNGTIPNYNIEQYTVIDWFNNTEKKVDIVQSAWCEKKTLKDNTAKG